jgi:hypothetical protein
MLHTLTVPDMSTHTAKPLRSTRLRNPGAAAAAAAAAVGTTMTLAVVSGWLLTVAKIILHFHLI